MIELSNDPLLRIQEAAARGAELLDKYQPDWFQKIDLEDLDLGGCYYCILGQLFDHYSIGVETLRKWNVLPRYNNLIGSTNGEDIKSEIEIVDSLGFDVNRSDCEDGYYHLTQAWLQEIGNRLKTTT